MNIAEVVLVYVCIPAGVTGIVAALVFGPSAGRRSRYRPGEAWAHEPVWFGPHPQMLDAELREMLTGTHDAGTHDADSHDAGRAAPALTSRSRLAITAGQNEPTPEPVNVSTARGGAHGDW